VVQAFFFSPCSDVWIIWVDVGLQAASSLSLVVPFLGTSLHTDPQLLRRGCRPLDAER
jgi:hypothetical protein